MDATHPPSLLIVEDEPLVLAALKGTLEREHFDVVACESPIKALALVKERDFAVIISDHKMPEMLGLEFLVECRRIRPQSSRILLTAVLNTQVAVDAINRGEIYRFVSKPWLREELIVTVNGAIHRHDLTMRNDSLRDEVARLKEELEAAHRAISASAPQPAL